MNKPDAREKVTLDQAIAAVRDEEVPSLAATAAAARVLQALTRPPQLRAEPAGGIRGCADVLALLPAFRRGALQAARAALVQDHLRECAACRAAYRQPGAHHLAILPWHPATPEVPPQRREGRAWARAASVLLALGLLAFAARQTFVAAPAGSRARVQSLRGALQRVSGGATRGLAAGEEIGEGEAVRTARGSQALLRLRDGSVVELGERAELSVTARGQDTTIHLERGNIIVQAAKRRVGHLVVAARDCTVYVTGTVFSVNRGLKGSRVSVIEGDVRVVQGRTERSLRAGDQLATNPTMGARSVREEIAWSGNLDAHLAVLAGLAELRKDLEAVRLPGLRYESRLLPLVPDKALVYASFSNYGAAFGEAYTLFEQRLAERPALKDWWERELPWRRGGPSLSQVIEKVRSFSDYLGDEVVFAAVDNGRGGAWPLLLAEVRRPGLREYIEAELQGNGGPKVRILDEDELGTARVQGELPILLRPDLIAIAVDAGAFRALAERLRDGGPGLDQTPFGQRIVRSYEDGVSILLGADLARISFSAAEPSPGATKVPLPPGVEGIRHLILEYKEDAGGQAQSHAELIFAGARRGIASWLGAPAPLGSLEFVSAHASAVGSFVVQSPALLLDDVLTMAGEGGVRRELLDLEARVKLSFREDVAATLGGEFTVALDGPLLPTPALEVIAEVYDPARLQASLQSLVNSWNEDAPREHRSPLRLEAEQVDARTYYALRSTDASVPLEVHYAFVDGYLVAAGSRALVMRAIQVREGGSSLPQSAGFRSLFPPDDRTNVSALLYQNLGSLVSGVARTPGAAGLSPGQRDAVAFLARQSPPTLLYAYGENDRIQVAGMGGLMALDPGNAALPALIGRLIPAVPARGVQ